MLLAALAALALIAVIAVLLLSGGGGDDGGGSNDQGREHAEEDRDARRPTKTPEETATPEPTATETATPAATDTPAPSGGTDLAKARQLQVQGYNARLAGDYAKSLDLSQQALDACGSSNELDPCGYALFEKGLALNRSGEARTRRSRCSRSAWTASATTRQGEVAKELEGREEGGEGLSTFDGVAAAIAGVPFMSPEQGRIVYDHVRAARPAEVLELGTAHGVGAAYMAAALRDNGDGRLTTVDFAGAALRPVARGRARPAPGVADRVEIVREFSSYTWWLKEQVQARSDADGNCEPRFDFVYLDGAKNWTVDGLAVVLAEKLLRPGRLAADGRPRLDLRRRTRAARPPTGSCTASCPSPSAPSRTCGPCSS